MRDDVQVIKYMKRNRLICGTDGGCEEGGDDHINIDYRAFFLDRCPRVERCNGLAM